MQYVTMERKPFSERENESLIFNFFLREKNLLRD